MNMNYIEYFSFTGDAASMTVKLNEFKPFCRTIKTIACYPAQTNLGQLILVIILELDFMSDEKKKTFHEKFIKPMTNGILKKA